MTQVTPYYVLTVEWLDAAEVQLPPKMLPVDLAQIRDIERVFFAWLAGVHIDLSDLLHHSIMNDVFRG
jgi:hypothetical protein